MKLTKRKITMENFIKAEVMSLTKQKRGGLNGNRY